ncbi:MAG TPA: acyl carrier protein [Chloroflexota bacterium]|nr:acyl carrier protein [Chloroflexota bacterium]
MEDLEHTLSGFIEREFAYDRAQPQVSAEEPLLDSGLVDSVGVLKLAAFIEEHFQIEVQDEDLVPENFSNVRAVAAFVRAKTTARA